MKKIIKNKLYNTDSAKYVADYQNIPYFGNYQYYKEALYRKKTGEFFLYGYGNAASKYAAVRGDRMRCPGEKILPLTEADAMECVEEHSDADTYIELFGEVEE